MNVFITGATGFIGCHVVKRLADTEHKLICLARPTSDVSELEEQDVTIIRGDVTDKDSLLEGMKGCQWVINLANLYSFWEPDKRIFTDVNVTGTRNVMECALETGIAKVVHVSTAGIYGKPAECPFCEDNPVGPERFSEYFRTKYEGDLIAWELHEKKGLPLLMIYPVGVLGPGDPKATGRYIQDLIHRRVPARVLEDSIFTFVHVRDVAEVIVRAAEKENNIGEKYLVGKHQLSWREINRMISEISGVALPKMSLPDFLTMFNARFLTLVANLIKKPPVWGMALDQIRTMKEGVMVDGS
ncbi:MAG: NAD-dependent epimerase/dehydratase family protein [Candidatus Zixiibacteriota bacterium]